MVFFADRPPYLLLAAAVARRALPRWLMLPVALPLFLVAGLAVGILVNLGFNGGAGPEGGFLTPASAATADGAAVSPPGACARMEYIVSTACALQQRDHDVEGARQCVAQELKYTMWSAYGCR